MLYGPWPRRGRLLRHVCFFFLLPALPQSWWMRPCQRCAGAPSVASLPLTWPHQDYIARLEEEEKAPQQSAAACGCQGPATAMVPAATAGGQGRGARPHPRCPAAHSPAVKDRSYNHGAQRPARGVGARCHHAGRQPTPAPRPARTGPTTEIHQHRGPSGTLSRPRWRSDRGSGPAGACSEARS